MFKKFLSLALAIMMIMSVAAIAASAAQVEIADDAADAVAEVAADGAAETGADSKIYFDASTTGWNNFGKIAFYVYQVGGDEIYPWGGWKKLSGTDEGNGIWSYDASNYGLQDGVQYAIIFVGTSTGMQTYNLLFDTSCIGDTAYCDGTIYENPEDSNKTAQAAFWKNHDASQYGPELKISSIGTVVGTCCAANTSPYKMFTEFLTNTLTNARQYSGKSDQDLLDDTAKALGIGQDLIQAALDETGVKADWKAAESKAEEKSDDGATKKGDGSDDTDAPSTNGDNKSNDSSSDSKSDSSSNSSNSSNSNSSSSGTTSSSKSGSASTSQTGQETTVLYIMLGVMVAAAGVIFFLRKRERA